MTNVSLAKGRYVYSNSKPLVSVVLPTYNRRCVIGQTITSVLNQEYKKLELIVVDDGSTDDTSSYIFDLTSHDSRVKYLALERNVGPAGARNHGLKNIKGDIIAFIDSDDVWFSDHLTKVVFALKNNSVDFYFCNFKVSENNKINYQSMYKRSILKMLYKVGTKHNLPRESLIANSTEVARILVTFGIVIGMLTFALRKSAIQCSFRDFLTVYEDQLFFLENLLRGGNVTFDNSDAGIVYERPGSLFRPREASQIIRKYGSEWRGREYLLRKYMNYFDYKARFALRTQIANKVNSLGNYHCRYGEMRIGLICYRISKKRIPFFKLVKKIKIMVKEIYIRLRIQRSIDSGSIVTLK